MPIIGPPQDPYAGITQGVSQLAKAFLSGPSPLERDYMRARTEAAEALGKSRVAEIQREAQRQSAMGALPGLITPSQPVSRPSAAFQGPMPMETSAQAYSRNEPDIWRNAAAAAPATDPGKASEIARMFAGFAGVDPSRMAQLRMGAGDNYAHTQRGFEADQAGDMRQALGVQDLGNQGAMERLQFELANKPIPVSAGSILATPGGEEITRGRTTDAVAKGEHRASLPADEQTSLLAGSQTPRNYVTPDGRRGVTLDSMTDAATGEELPPGWQVYSTVTDATPASIVADDYKARKAVNRFRALTNFTRSLAEKDPANFGFPGFIKGTVQDVRALVDGVARSMGYANPDSAFKEVRARIVKNPDVDPSLLSGVFDPNLTSLQSAADLLAFSAAEALANQQGRSVSDRDIKIFKDIVGDPGNFFTSQEKFLAKLQTMENIVDAFGRADEGSPAPADPEAAPAPVESYDPLGIIPKQ